ncbi:hypothetical protein BYT27DRAFT_7334095 [Phlegmacium glaucopus]|nr:hypothetical protein BYT27DRAFT_7334095 [Phlegmacium glaucopus]
MCSTFNDLQIQMIKSIREHHLQRLHSVTFAAYLWAAIQHNPTVCRFINIVNRPVAVSLLFSMVSSLSAPRVSGSKTTARISDLINDSACHAAIWLSLEANVIGVLYTGNTFNGTTSNMYDRQLSRQDTLPADDLVWTKPPHVPGLPIPILLRNEPSISSYIMSDIGTPNSTPQPLPQTIQPAEADIQTIEESRHDGLFPSHLPQICIELSDLVISMSPLLPLDLL